MREGAAGLERRREVRRVGLRRVRRLRGERRRRVERDVALVGRRRGRAVGAGAADGVREALRGARHVLRGRIHPELYGLDGVLGPGCVRRRRVVWELVEGHEPGLPMVARAGARTGGRRDARHPGDAQLGEVGGVEERGRVARRLGYRLRVVVTGYVR